MSEFSQEKKSLSCTAKALNNELTFMPCFVSMDEMDKIPSPPFSFNSIVLKSAVLWPNFSPSECLNLGLI